MENPDKEKYFETAEKECQASVEKVIDDYEKPTSVHTAAQLAAFKLRAEKSFLQKKQEAMKRWMDKHREESTKTIIRVCNTARAIVERMAKEKEKEMQEMIAEMEKAHQEELNQIRIETRREALRDFLKSNAKFIYKQKPEEEDCVKSSKTNETRTMNSSPSKLAEEPLLNKVLQISLEDVLVKNMKANNAIEKKPVCETKTVRESPKKPQDKKVLPHDTQVKKLVILNNTAEKQRPCVKSTTQVSPSKTKALHINLNNTPAKKSKPDNTAEIKPPCDTPTRVSPAKSIQKEEKPYNQHETPTKKVKLDYMADKQPFCEIEMCAIRGLNQPISKQVIIELAKKPRHNVMRILEEEKRKASMMEGKSFEKRSQTKENTVSSNSVDVRNSISEESYSLNGESAKLFTCNACGRTDTDMLMCGGCYGNYYCDETCQTRDWQLHQQWCTVNDE